MHPLQSFNRLLCPGWKNVNEHELPRSFGRVYDYLVAAAPRLFPPHGRPHRTSIQRYHPCTCPVFKIGLHFATHDAAVVAKFFVGGDADREYRCEKDSFCEFNRRHGNGEFRCPEVVAWLPGQRVLITNYQSGASLLTDLLFARLHPSALQSAMTRVGSWLASFHKLEKAMRTPRTDMPRTLDAYAPHLCDDALLSNVQGVLNADVVHQIVDLRSVISARRALPGTARLGLIHGDFGPANIVTNPDKIVVLDSSRCSTGPSLVDICSFFGGLATAGRLRGLRLDSVRNLFDTFYSAYARVAGSSDIDVSLWRVFAVDALLRHFKRHLSFCKAQSFAGARATEPLLRWLYSTSIEVALNHVPNIDMMGVAIPAASVAA